MGLGPAKAAMGKEQEKRLQRWWGQTRRPLLSRLGSGVFVLEGCADRLAKSVLGAPGTLSHPNTSRLQGCDTHFHAQF